MMCVCECKKKLEFHFFKMVVGVYIGGPHDRPSFLVKIRAGNPISLSRPVSRSSEDGSYTKM